MSRSRFDVLRPDDFLSTRHVLDQVGRQTLGPSRDDVDDAVGASFLPVSGTLAQTNKLTDVKRGLHKTLLKDAVGSAPEINHKGILSGCERLAALLHPKLVQKVDIGLAPLAVSGPEFFADVLLELFGAGASLDFLQFDLMLEIDVAERPRDLFHHQVKAGRVHSVLLAGVIGHVSLQDCSSLFGATLIQELYGVLGQYR
jgi:hypothetical protein